MKLAKNFELEITQTPRSIVTVDGTRSSCNGILSNTPVKFGDIVVRLRLMNMNKVPFETIIGDLMQVKMR